MKEEKIIRELTKAQTDAEKIRQLEDAVKRLQAEVLEYVRVEQVLMVARKLDEETIRQAHELVRTCS